MSVVDVVLPCLDEAGALPWVLGRMPAWARPIVADNGSVDGSREVAREHGARVVDVPVRGYGAACHAGLEAATSELVAFMDADASLDPHDLEVLLAAHRAGADLVVGRRRPTQRGAWPWHLRVANAVVAHRLHRRSGVRLHDIGPVRLGRREDLLGAGITDRRSGYPLETVVRVAERGLRVVEVDVAYRPRTGRSKVTGTPLGVARAVQDMSRVLAR